MPSAPQAIGQESYSQPKRPNASTLADELVAANYHHCPDAHPGTRACHTRPIWAPPGRGVQRVRPPTFVRAQTVLASLP